MHSIARLTNEQKLVIVILFAGLVLRVLFLQSYAHPVVSPDTYGYNLVGNRILKGEQPLLNDERTPVYPLFFKIVMNLSGRTNDRLDTVDFEKGAKNIAIFQMFVSLICSYIFYRALQLVSIHPILRYIGMFIYTSDFIILSWDNALLTESLSISLMTAVLYLTLLVVKYNKWKYTFLLTLLLTIGYLLRPVFLVLPCCIYPILILKKQTLQKRIALVALGCITMIFPFLTYVINTRTYEYRGLNHITDINVLGRLLKDKIPVESAKNNQFYSEVAKHIRGTNANSDPYYFLYTVDPTLLVRTNNRKELNELKDFTDTVIHNQWPAYTVGALRDIPSALGDPQNPIHKPENLSFHEIWIPLYLLRNVLQYLFTFLPILISLLVIRLLFSHGTTQYFKQSLLTIISLVVGFTLSVVGGGYSDFQRLLSPITPLVYFMASSLTAIFPRNKS